MAADWTAIEDALQAWVVAASGLPGERVIWDEQDGPRPATWPFISLRLHDDAGAGLLDETRVSDNPSGVAGNPLAVPPTIGTELILETVAHVNLVVTVQAFSKDKTGPNTARAVLAKVKNYLSTEDQITAFDASGIAIIDRGVVQNLTGVLSTEHESRAALEVRFRVADGVAQTATYIETTEFTDELT